MLARPDIPVEPTNSSLDLQIRRSFDNLAGRIKYIKAQSESDGNKSAPHNKHIRLVGVRLKENLEKYSRLHKDFESDLQATAERQYRILRPNAPEEEVREAVSDSKAHIFQQAVR